ncbi:MAG: SGNH/GDSL hydrolase family protein [Acidobacteriota bacterium]
MKTLRYVLGMLLITFVLSVNAYAQSISQIVVLGDSLSDNGNFYAATGSPAPPYWQGRASNGPVAVEYLAQSLGVPLRDFAWYAATTGIGNVADGGTVDTFGPYSLPGITTVFQGALFYHLFPIDPHALYVVWGGPNDFWYVTDDASASVAIGKAVNNLVNIVTTLQSLGAKQILVPNMPDLGKLPLILAYGPLISDFFTQISLGFNQALQASLPQGVHYFNTFSLFANIVGNPDEYGFANVKDPFMLAPLGADPNKYLSFDGVHPTTAGHAILGNALYQSVAPTVIIGGCNSGVPNPLFSTGYTISDLIAQAAISANNHGQFVSTVASITNGLMKSGVVSGSQKGAIQSCAAKAKIP